MNAAPPPRVVITGMGVISPLGCTTAELLDGLRCGRSGIDRLTRIPSGVLSVDHGAEVTSFTGEIEDYGPLDKNLQRTIRKGSKLMCREIEMGVAAAQLAIHDAQLTPDNRDADRTGVIYGCDYIMTLPEEFAAGIQNCFDESGNFQFGSWATKGLPQVNPLWLLKYLPNMPASHIAIYNDLRGPNNSITVREASPAAALWEALSTLCRGHADVLIVGATGSRIQTFRSLHASMQEPLATASKTATPEELAATCRPFDQQRSGSVLGEGAAALILETLPHARARGARILGEVLGGGSSAVGPQAGSGNLRLAMANAIRMATRDQNPASIGHVHAHGLGSIPSDREEAEAIRDVFGDSQPDVPVTTAKGHFGNLGAGGGMVEIVASLAALRGELFPVRNCPDPDPACPIRVVNKPGIPAGESFVSLNVTPQGQASAVHIRAWQEA
ncbi:MAG: beta-ketoacyl-[acyl-carrier-protein] synthase family protein [Planctomycetaceae bacterium]|nr:MAG: beta-ketoacyl-[acyl-carrier-protein] synthase family protein [Planctomycetaceae bacterium]